MLCTLPFRSGTTHREVFYCATKTGDLVPFEMAHHDHAVSCYNISRDRHSVKTVSYTHLTLPTNREV